MFPALFFIPERLHSALEISLVFTKFLSVYPLPLFDILNVRFYY